MENRLMSLTNAAEYMGIKKSTMYRLVSGGIFPTVIVGNTMKVDVQDLDRYIESNRSQK